MVEADETSWGLNSVWAFLSEKARVLVFGCRKDGETLAQLLPKDGFVGILVSDDAAVYQGFSNAQKCWAHLIRKAIRFTLLQPDNAEYKDFLEGLLAVFTKANRSAADQRLKESGRAARVAELFDDVCELCFARCSDESLEPKSGDETDREFHNLATKSRGCRATKSYSRLCFIRRLTQPTMKLNAVFEVRLRTAEPVARVKHFEVLSGEQF